MGVTDNTFRTTLPATHRECVVTVNDTIFCLGSCFAENISAKLSEGLMDSYANPFGPAYNPLSILSALDHIISLTPPDASEMVCDQNGTWRSYMAHTKISAQTKEDLVEKISREAAIAHAALERATMVIITLGTSFVYELKTTGKIVANCLKMPDSNFSRRRISVDEATTALESITNSIHAFNPKAHIIFTVSPIRHIKDTLHGNQLSKATLLLAIDNAIAATSCGAEYFEAYETLIDDLRDYRFYADDMVHPSNLAINYIYRRFIETFFAENTIKYISETMKIHQATQHRPVGDMATYKGFIGSTLQKAEEIRKRYSVGEHVHTFAQAIEMLNDIKSSLNN